MPRPRGLNVVATEIVFMLLIRVVEYGTKPIPDRQPFVPLLRTGDGGRKSEPDLGSQRINGTLVSFSLSWQARKLHLRPLPCIWGSAPESRFQAVAARMPMTLMFAVAAKHKQNIVFTVTAKHKTRYFSIRTSQDPILLMNEAYQR